MALVAVIITHHALSRRPDPRHGAVRLGADRGRVSHADVSDYGGRRMSPGEEIGDSHPVVFIEELADVDVLFSD